MIYVSLSAKGIKSSISSLVVYRNVAKKLLDKPYQSFIMRLKVFIYPQPVQIKRQEYNGAGFLFFNFCTMYTSCLYKSYLDFRFLPIQIETHL